jgi:glycosyltransferase involved in cell wall biosynthesis
LNIVFLNDTAYVNGGVAKVAIMEANGLVERGHHVTFIACDAGAPDRPRELDPRVELHCTGQKEILESPPATAVIQGIHNRKAIRLTNQILKSYDRNNTIVHLHAWSKALSPAIIPALLEHEIPTVCTLHDYFSVCPNGTLYNHVKQDICNLQPMSAACIKCNCDSRSYTHKLWRVSRFYAQHHWYGLPRRLTHLLTPSHFSKHILTRYLPADCVIDVLGNPIECEKEPAVNVAANDRIIYVGRLSAEKGVRIFLQAARQVGIRAVIVGDGPEATALKHEFPEAEFLGWLPGNHTQKVMRTARALVFPSLWYECDPLIIKEAASIGLPVIASDRSAAVESVIENETGFHFQSGNRESLVYALARAINDDSNLTRMGESAYKRFWAAPNTVGRHIDLLTHYYTRMHERS